MKQYPVWTKYRLKDECGMSLIETLIIATIVGVMLMAMADMTILFHRTKKQNNLITSTLGLESEFLGAISNMSHFSDPILKARMNDGVTLPPISLRDSKGNPFIELPATPRLRRDIKPLVAYFDRDSKPCASFDGANCVVRLEASLIMKSGPTDLRAPEGSPEWIRPGSSVEKASRFPVYAVAYRITVDPAVQSVRPRGLSHMNAITEVDHIWPVPHEQYMPLAEVKTCSGNGVLVGTHPDTREPICAEPTSLCPDSTFLAKQVVVDGNKIGVECVPWRSISCPENYVVSEFMPSLLDSEAPRPPSGDYGRCVYFGADKGSRKSRSSKTDSTDLTCSNKYDISGTCSLVEERVIRRCSWVDAFGVTHYQDPNRGTAEMNKMGSTLVCSRRNPANFCDPPYSGGKWTSEVELDATCKLRPSERTKPLDAS